MITCLTNDFMAKVGLDTVVCLIYMAQGDSIDIWLENKEEFIEK